MRTTRLRILIALLLLTLASAASADLESELAQVQAQWAQANYQLPAQQRAAAFDELATRTARFAQAYPGRAEPLVWHGIVLGSSAGAKGGLGALGLAKQARAALEAAEAIDPLALDGSVLTSLGSLYYKVPGWPLGFGNTAKARNYLERGLAANPAGIDPNYFYGEFLLQEGDTAGAIAALERALAASPRPGREVADQGRRAEAAALLARAGAQQAPRSAANEGE